MKHAGKTSFLFLRAAKASGFMLIELIVATMIASLVAAVLLTSLNMGNRFKVGIDNTIDMSERIGILANVLEKDLMGAFIPTASDATLRQAQGERGEDKAEDEAIEEKKQLGDKKSDDKNKQSAQPAAEKKAPKPIEKIFYSTNKNNMLDMLTFTTNDPLVVFVGKDVGEVKPKAVRVQYTLQPESGKKDSYALLRQESKELDLAEYKNVRAYEVIGGIKKITAKFVARIQKKSSSAKATADTSEDKQEPSSAKAMADTQKEKIEYEYKELAEWVSEPSSAKATADTAKESGEKGKDEPEFPRIPYYVEFVITLWDQDNSKDKDFTLLYEIPVDFSPPKKQEKKQFRQQKKDDVKSDNLGNEKQKDGSQKIAHNVSGSTQETVVIEKLNSTLSNLTKLLKQM